MMRACIAIVCLLTLTSCVASPSQTGTATDSTPLTPTERDRQAIRTLAGVYEVVIETRDDALSPGESALQQTTAIEAVRITEDLATRITLEHLLLIGEPPVVARRARQTWRQLTNDRWVFEPVADPTISGRWRVESFRPADRSLWAIDIAGADNRPLTTRVGRWSHTGSVSTWVQTTPTLEPGNATQPPAPQVMLRSITLTTTPAGWSTLSPTVPHDGEGNATGTILERIAYRRIADAHPATEPYGQRHDAYWQTIQSRWEELRQQKLAYQLRTADDQGQALWQRILERSTQGPLTGPQIDATLAPFLIRE
jgi:hypothetical protein